MIISLESKRVVVTGGSSGLGEAMSIAAAAAGAKVAIIYSRETKKAKAVVVEIKAAGGEAFAIKADVSNPKAVAMLFAKVEQRWGGIDTDGTPAMRKDLTTKSTNLTKNGK